jgi:hypothetical protein
MRVQAETCLERVDAVYERRMGHDCISWVHTCVEAGPHDKSFPRALCATKSWTRSHIMAHTSNCCPHGYLDLLLLLLRPLLLYVTCILLPPSVLGH